MSAWPSKESFNNHGRTPLVPPPHRFAAYLILAELAALIRPPMPVRKYYGLSVKVF